MELDNLENMDFADAGLTYALLIIPTFFALAVTGQGLYKLSKNDESGKIITGFGILFFVLIIAAYFFFIK